MNHLITTAISLAVALPVLAEKPEPFTSKEGKFTVSLPGQPVEGKPRETTIAGSKVTGRGYSYTDKEFRFFYGILYGDLPPQVVRADGAGKLLDKIRDDWAKQNKRKVIKEEQIELGKQKYPGRELLFETPKGNVDALRTRLFLVGNHFYMVIVSAPEKSKYTSAKEATAFLDSFKVSD